ncbi:MAG: hypothetical protein GXO85_00675 [Chlorobi bacterium]|nr:hypothetical protein [Chlorobiota bacterium]
MKYLVIILASLFFIISCSEKAPVETTNGEGNVVLSFNKSEIPDSVYLIEVFLKRDGFDTITKELNPKNDSNAEVYFEEVAVGNWNLDVNAYSINHNLLYTGEAIIYVEANKVTPVFIQLHYVNGDRTGSVYIYISWESPINVGWFDYPANPILEMQNNSFDNKGVLHPFVLKVDNGFIMWYTGLAGNSSHIYAANSSDGLNWTPYSSEPVLSPDPASSWENRNVTGSFVIKENGLFKMYYTGRSSSESDYSQWNIGLATSEDGYHWKRRKDPVFRGAVGQWDLKVGVSDIEIIDGVYYMYYTGKTYLSDHQIGIATSIDGITWERYGANPVLADHQSWEGAGYYYPTVIKTDGSYYMIYMNSVSNVSGFGYATSTDGLNWEKSKSNPFFHFR